MAASKSPVYLNLLHIRLPLPGWVSILQRMSGALLFVLLPVLIYLFHLLLDDAGYTQLMHWQQLWPVRLLIMAVLWAYLQHFLAGIRFLMLDIHIGARLPLARRLAGATLVVSGLLTLLIAGAWW